MKRRATAIITGITMDTTTATTMAMTRVAKGMVPRVRKPLAATRKLTPKHPSAARAEVAATVEDANAIIAGKTAC